jgi:hypothetical protein
VTGSPAPAWLGELLGDVCPVTVARRGRGVLVRLEFGGGRWLAVGLAPRDASRAAGWRGALCQADARGSAGLRPEEEDALVAHVGRCLDPAWPRVLGAAPGPGGGAGWGRLRDAAAGRWSPGAPPRGSGRLDAAIRWVDAAFGEAAEEAGRARAALVEAHGLPDDEAVLLDEAGAAWGAGAARSPSGAQGRLSRARCLLAAGRPHEVASAIGRIWGPGTDLTSRREAARLLAAVGARGEAEHALRHNAASGQERDVEALRAFLSRAPLPPAPRRPDPRVAAAGALLSWLSDRPRASAASSATSLDPDLRARIEAFSRDGLVHLPGALGPDGAAAWFEACRAEASADPARWLDLENTGADAADALRFRPDAPETWIRGRFVLRARRGLDLAAATPRLHALICALVGGHERLASPELPRRAVVQWPAAPEGHRPPAALAWHIDDPDPAMTLEGRELGLLVLVLLRDAAPEDGATVLDRGSPGRIARLLRDAGPIDTADPAWGPTVARTDDLVAAGGHTGDAWLVHPWTLHSAGTSRSGALRVFANSSVFLRGPMRFEGPGLSPVEEIAARALR